MSEVNQISLKNALKIIKKTAEYTLSHDIRKQAFVIYSLPGIGKSEGLKNLAKSPEHIAIIDINAEFGGSLSMPIQEVIKDKDNQKARALVMHALHEDIAELKTHALKNPKDPHYLFLDEFNRGDEFMKQTLMQLLLNTKLPGHDLPPNIFVIGAGNTSENIFTAEVVENEVNPLDVAARDRIAPLFVGLNVKDWTAWAYQNKVNPHILMFIEQAQDQQSVLYKAPQTEDSTGATPRSWTKLSDLLEVFDPKQTAPSILKPLIQSQIGVELTDRFINFLTTTPQFDIKDLLKDKTDALKKFEDLSSADARQALLSMPYFIEKNLEAGNKEYLDSFEEIMKTKDQTNLVKFINIYLENDALRKNYTQLYKHLNKSEQFNKIRGLYSANM